MISLPNGCSCSEPTIYPANWKTGGKSLLKCNWYIQYRFRDPGQDDEFQKKYKYGYPVRVKFKRGVQSIEDLRTAAAQLTSEVRRMLIIDGYNPITKSNKVPTAIQSDIPGSTLFINALRSALSTIKVGKGSKYDLTSIIKYVESAADALSLDTLQIDQVKRKHIKLILEHLGKTKKRWSANTHNWYLSYLTIIFNELIEFEAIEHNPVSKISRMNNPSFIRETLSKDQRHLVDHHLRKKGSSRFRLYIRLFFHSGIRSTELLALKAKDVDLERQVIRVTIRKRRNDTQVQKTIKDIALPFWWLALKECQPEDYIFSNNLFPGPKRINAIQISRRWKKYVKDPKVTDAAGNIIYGEGGLGINADFYSFKHANTTEIVNSIGEKAASELNSHTSVAMVRKIYDVDRVPREHDKIRKAGNDF